MLHPEVLPLARHFRQAGLSFWLIGGQAVELLSPVPVRPHDDIDFLIRADQGEAALALLSSLGFTHHHGSLEAGNVFVKRGELLVDLVPVTESPPRTLGDLASIPWPPGFLGTHTVQRDGVPVPTLTPAMNLAMKDFVAAYYGVPLREKDEVDVRVLRGAIEAASGSGD